MIFNNLFRILRNQLHDLKIQCTKGCSKKFKYVEFHSHEVTCGESEIKKAEENKEDVVDNWQL